MGLLEMIDSSITDLFSQWNAYSTVLATALVVLVTYRIMSATEPDAHPFLLARQAMPSAVRNEDESAVYRSQSAPHGMPLNAGLNIKDPGAPKFSRGRDGDLRDVWRKAAAGGHASATARLLTVFGSENVIAHKIGMASYLYPIYVGEHSKVWEGAAKKTANMSKPTSIDKSMSSADTSKNKAPSKSQSISPTLSNCS